MSQQGIEVISDKGTDLYALSFRKPLFIVFLRHFGCTFCRETLVELKNKSAMIEASGKTLVIVHMMSLEVGRHMLAENELSHAYQISDPERMLYKHFRLNEGSLSQVFGLRNWGRMFEAGLVKGHLLGWPRANFWQMPGFFLLHKGEVVKEFRPQKVSEKPDFEEIYTYRV